MFGNSKWRLFFRTLIFVPVVCIHPVSASGEEVGFATAIGGPNQENALAIAVDGSGNVYTTGFFDKTPEIDPITGVSDSNSKFYHEIYVNKLDASGKIVWTKNMSGSDDEQGNAIAVDAAGNIFITGYFRTTVDFDPGEGVDNHTSSGVTSIFIQKLDSDGNFVWVRSIGGKSADQGSAIAVDASGNVYATGSFGEIVDFDPGSNTYELDSAGELDIFMLKLDASGNFVWARNMGGEKDDFALDIFVDASGDIYTTGYFEDTANFDTGDMTVNLISNGGYDLFVQKTDSDGNLVWVRSVGGQKNDHGTGITVDASGNVVVTGSFEKTVDFDPGPDTSNFTSSGLYDIFVQKLDAEGNFIWGKSMGGASRDFSHGITTDASNNIYITGRFWGTADFDPDFVATRLTSAGLFDIFLQKMDSDGNFIWAKVIGGEGNDVSMGIVVDDSGDVYTTGSFSGLVDFDPTSDTFNVASAGTFDIFVLKLIDPKAPVQANVLGWAIGFIVIVLFLASPLAVLKFRRPGRS